jgi:hypothetical protein
MNDENPGSLAFKHSRKKFLSCVKSWANIKEIEYQGIIA